MVTYIRPDYVSSFRCDGRACGSRCCRDWRVPMDPVTCRKYAEMEGGRAFSEWFSDRDEKGNYPVRLKEDGTCPFLREDGLCRMQAEHGEAYLSDICYTYPRVSYRVGNTLVQSLTMTCPLALGLLLEHRGSAGIHKIRTEEWRRGWQTDMSDRVRPYGASWSALQLAGVRFLQMREFTLDQCLFFLLLFYRDASSRMEAGGSAALPGLLESLDSGEFAGKALEEMGAGNFREREHAGIMVELFHEIYGLPADGERLLALQNIYQEHYPVFVEEFLRKRRFFFENYLVNEFFLRFYPYAYRESTEQNAKAFLLTWKVVECALLMMSVKSGMDPEGILLGIDRMTERLDHNRSGMEAIRRILWKMGEMDAGAFAEKLLRL